MGAESTPTVRSLPFFIPNFEPVTLLLILYTLHFPRMTPLIIYVFVAVQVLLYGFNVWVYMYL